MDFAELFSKFPPFHHPTSSISWDCSLSLQHCTPPPKYREWPCISTSFVSYTFHFTGLSSSSTLAIILGTVACVVLLAVALFIINCMYGHYVRTHHKISHSPKKKYQMEKSHFSPVSMVILSLFQLSFYQIVKCIFEKLNLAVFLCTVCICVIVKCNL